ncbi:MAG: hypothetical protein WC791_02660 [Candidatus Paceibacterota bacterium]
MKKVMTVASKVLFWGMCFAGGLVVTLALAGMIATHGAPMH